MLIPPRGPHLAPAPGPAQPAPGVETVSQPACRRGRGSRVADGPAGGESGTPSRDRPCREWIGAQVAAGSPEVAWAPSHQGLRPEVTRIRTSTGSAGGGKEARTATQARHREATRGTDPMTGPASGGAGRTRWASSPPRTEGLLVLIPPGDLQNSDRPPACPVGDRGRTGTKIHTTRRLAASAR